MRKSGLVAAVAIFALTLSGCGWLQIGGGAARSGFNPNESTITAANVSQLVPVWTATVPASPNPPAVQGNNVHITSAEDYTVVDATTGSIYWHENFTEPSGLPVYLNAPTVIDKKAHVPMTIWRNGGIRVFDPATKTFSGSINGLSLSSSVAVRDDVSAVVSQNVIPFEVLTLLQYGSFQGFLDYGGLPAASATEPSIIGNRAFVGYGNALVSFPLGSCLPSQPPAPPEFPFCWHETRVDLGSIVSMPVGVTPNLVAVGTGAGDLKVLNAADGTTAATADLGSTRVIAPAVANGMVYAVNEAGVLSAVPASGCTTCTPTWTANLGAAGYTQPIVAGGVVYVGSANGKVSAFSASGCGSSTCPALWSTTVDANADVLNPVVTNGKLFVTADTGTVKAYKLP